jgi:hypothetical protein
VCIGGASNTGSAVLRHFFEDDRLRELTKGIDVSQSPGLDYYPLLKPGERCPVRFESTLDRITPRHVICAIGSGIPARQHRIGGII